MLLVYLVAAISQLTKSQTLKSRVLLDCRLYLLDLSAKFLSTRAQQIAIRMTVQKNSYIGRN